MTLDINLTKRSFFGSLEEWECFCCLEADRVGNPLITQLLLNQIRSLVVVEKVDAVGIALKPELLSQKSNINIGTVTLVGAGDIAPDISFLPEKS